MLFYLVNYELQALTRAQLQALKDYLHINTFSAIVNKKAVPRNVGDLQSEKHVVVEEPKVIVKKEPDDTPQDNEAKMKEDKKPRKKPGKQGNIATMFAKVAAKKKEESSGGCKRKEPEEKAETSPGKENRLNEASKAMTSPGISSQSKRKRIQVTECDIFA